MLERRVAREPGDPYRQRPVAWLVLAATFTCTTVIQVFLAVSTAEWWPIPVAAVLGSAAVWCGVLAGRSTERKG